MSGNTKGTLHQSDVKSFFIYIEYVVFFEYERSSTYLLPILS